MTPQEYCRLDAVAIDGFVADGSLRPADLAAAARAVHESTDAKINAVIEWYDDPTPPRGVATAAAALRGVPILRKDYGSAEAGRLVEMGSRLAAGNRATETAPFVSKLQAAGAQIVGRSAVPEFIQHGVTESRVHGVTRNPWNVSISAGGSSGGAAAAVAAGVVPIAHASDCAGSIRIPASTCGLVGLKPSRGRVPWPGQDWNGIATEFVVCRSVRDAHRCLEVLAIGDYAPVPERMRVAMSTQHWAGNTPDSAVVDATEAIADVLAEVGHQVDVVGSPVDYAAMMQTWPVAFSRFTADDAARLADSTGRTIDSATVEPMTLAAIATVSALTPADRTTSAGVRGEVVERLEAELADHDVILTPTLGRATLALNALGGELDPDDYFDLNDETFPYSYLFNLSGWPSISVPAGTDAAGNPIGVQLSARIGSEQLLLHLAAAIELARPWPLLAPLH